MAQLEIMEYQVNVLIRIFVSGLAVTWHANVHIFAYIM